MVGEKVNVWSFLFDHHIGVEVVGTGRDQRQRAGGEGIGDGEHCPVGVAYRTGGPHGGRWRVYPLLLLASVAEPHSHHFLFHAEAVRQHGDLLRGRLGVLHESLLEGHAHAGLDGRSFLSAASDRFWRR